MNQKPTDSSLEDIEGVLSLLLSGSKYLGIKSMFARNLNTPAPILEKLTKSKNKEIRKCIAENPSTSIATLEALAMDRARDVRVAVVENRNTPLPVFEKLAEDKTKDVQQAVHLKVASNPNTPVRYVCHSPIHP